MACWTTDGECRAEVVRRLGRFGGPDDAAVIVPAVRARAVLKLRLVAVGARLRRRNGRFVMRASFSSTGLGVAPFRIGHCGGPFALSDRYDFDNFFNASHRGSVALFSQEHVPVFWFVPQDGHRPRQSSRHSNLLGTASTRNSRRSPSSVITCASDGTVCTSPDSPVAGAEELSGTYRIL
jgi:hypothetical protein